MTRYIGYVTRDEVNAALARKARVPDDVRVCHSDSEDGLPNVRLTGIAYDLDHMWPDERSRVVIALGSVPPLLPTVIHSYNVETDQEELFRLMGVEVRRPASEETFQQLAGVGVPARRAA